MRNSFLLLFCFGLSCSHGVVGEDDLVKKSAFPYMAFIYYSDSSVVDDAGARFIRSAVLIRADWLVTSALGPSVIDSNGFPMKTLMARVGAVTIDANFNFNEDEDEQEREVIQIVRPYNHSATQWWTTDISLMKMLLPFNMTAVVDIKNINNKREFIEKTCIILFYAKSLTNQTEDKALMQKFVEVLPPTMDNCGNHFSANTMICATESDENKDAVYDPKFCQGNSGGPLICEGEVMGLQTYIGNNCKAPHLYQLLSSWDNFISCGIEDKCQEEHCGNICDVTYKDPPKTESLSTRDAVVLVTASTSTKLTMTTTVPETITPDGDILTTTTIFTTTEEQPLVTETTTSTTEMPTPTLTPNYSETTETRSWPKKRTEKRTEERKVLVDEEDERNANIEAQMQQIKKISAADRNMCLVQTIVFGLVLCLF